MGTCVRAQDKGCEGARDNNSNSRRFHTALRSVCHLNEKSAFYSSFTMATTATVADAQWLRTAQGATLNGIQAADEMENIVWRFCTFLREAIFSFPSGASVEEYEEYIYGLISTWKVSFLQNISYQLKSK